MEVAECVQWLTSRRHCERCVDDVVEDKRGVQLLNLYVQRERKTPELPNGNIHFTGIPTSVQTIIPLDG